MSLEQVQAGPLEEILKDYDWARESFGISEQSVMQKAAADARTLASGQDWRISTVTALLDRFCGGSAGRRVLDAGCGTGSSLIMGTRQGLEWFGFDPDPGSIAIARRLGAACGIAQPILEDRLRHSDGRFIPFDDASFHLAFSYQVVEHVPDIHGYLTEIYRKLVPGGLLALWAPDYRYAFEVHYGIPWIPFLHRDLAPLWCAAFGKPAAGLSSFNYVTQHQVAGIAHALGYQVLHQGLIGVNQEELIQAQTRRILDGVPPYAVSAADIPRLADKAARNAAEFRSESFMLLLRRP